MSYPYEEPRVIDFTQQALALYAMAGATADINSSVWLGRMQFDAVSIGYDEAFERHLGGLRQALGISGGGETPPVVVPPQGPVNGNYQDWFRGVVADRPFGQATLLALEPTLNAAGVLLTPANAAGDRTKIGIPQGDGSYQWVRVGFGEVMWVWVVQP